MLTTGGTTDRLDIEPEWQTTPTGALVEELTGETTRPGNPLPLTADVRRAWNEEYPASGHRPLKPWPWLDQHIARQRELTGRRAAAINATQRRVPASSPPQLGELRDASPVDAPTETAWIMLARISRELRDHDHQAAAAVLELLAR